MAAASASHDDRKLPRPRAVWPPAEFPTANDHAADTNTRCPGRISPIDSMGPIRIHLGQMPPMLRAMINDLLTAEPDMAVVGNSYAGDDSLLAASSESAELLIAQEQTSLGETCLSAVITDSPAAILAISTSGNSGTSVNLVRRPISLEGTGALALPDTVRAILGRK